MRTLVTFGLGALAMYLLDPRQGRQRRAFIRDRLGRAKGLLRRRAEGTAHELSFREYVESTQARRAEPDASTQAPQSAQHLGR